MKAPKLNNRLKQAVSLHQAGKLKQAAAIYRKILKQAPEHPDALQLLGLLSHQSGRHDQAIRLINKAILYRPDITRLHNNLGEAYRALNQLELAVLSYKRALKLDPKYAPAHHNLGIILDRQGSFYEAIKHYEATLKYAPNFAPGYKHLADTLVEIGCVHDAIPYYLSALKVKPDYPSAWSNYLFSLNYLPELTPSETFREHQKWGQTLSTSVIALKDRSLSKDRPLNVAYVSRDFRKHALNKFLEPILSNHDTDAFMLTCYSDVLQPDETTKRLKSFVQQWRNTSSLSDNQLAKLIQKDKVDILIDLAGHSAKNRLGVFAMRSAPIQATYLGYPNTTGLTTMDYRLTDPIADPANDPSPSTETLFMLEKGFCCFCPPFPAPDIKPLPYQSNHYLTFGSLHKTEKLNNAVLSLWCQLLEAIPTAKILIFRDDLTPDHKKRLSAFFKSKNISYDRCIIKNQVPEGKSYLDVYNEIDICLDTFPWNGHTIACDALWMGVPTLTLCGQSHSGRMVSSVLTQVQLEQFIANSPSDYVDRAVHLAKTACELKQLRHGLRSTIRASSLCDAKGFTLILEQGYRQMWKNYCLQRSLQEKY